MGEVTYITQCHHCLKIFRERDLCGIDEEKGQPVVCVKCYKVWRLMADAQLSK